MKNIPTEKSRLPWSKPELRRIDAGSAEATIKAPGTPDGGTNANQKNFS